MSWWAVTSSGHTLKNVGISSPCCMSFPGPYKEVLEEDNKVVSGLCMEPVQWVSHSQYPNLHGWRGISCCTIFRSLGGSPWADTFQFCTLSYSQALSSPWQTIGSCMNLSGLYLRVEKCNVRTLTSLAFIDLLYHKISMCDVWNKKIKAHYIQICESQI